MVFYLFSCYVLQKKSNKEVYFSVIIMLILVLVFSFEVEL